MIKKLIKNFSGYVLCKINCIDNLGGVYIGRNTKIIGGNKIFLGKGVCIRPNVDLWCTGESIKIGNGVEIGERCRISISRKLIIGDKVLISPNVYITDCDHAYEDIHIPVIDQGIVNKENNVVIHKHSYIGINSVIVGNVTIGQGCVIGANSVVTKDIPDYCVAVGSPAKIIKKYNFDKSEWERV